MQKIINDPSKVVDQMLQGFTKAMSDSVMVTKNKRVLKYRKCPVKGKVGIVTGGGSGHKPAFIGYIGRNMVDSVAVGEIFSSPPAKMFYDAFKEADSGHGVACLYGNYAGDNMNVAMAIEMAQEDGITVKKVVANDDVASAKKAEKEKRRGVAGEVFMFKVAGAKAAMGGTLDEVIETSQKAVNNTRSMGVGLAPCAIPEVGHPNFEIEEGKMELGIGHHGEPGIEVRDIETADEIAKTMLDKILLDLPFSKGDEVAVLISGLGQTPLIEQYIFFNGVEEILSSKGISIYKKYVGNYFTSLEMAGISLTLMKLDDDLKECIDYEADSMALKQFGRR